MVETSSHHDDHVRETAASERKAGQSAMRPSSRALKRSQTDPDLMIMQIKASSLTGPHLTNDGPADGAIIGVHPKIGGARHVRWSIECVTQRPLARARV